MKRVDSRRNAGSGVLVMYEEGGDAWHMLAGRRVSPGDLISVQLADGSWVTGTYFSDRLAAYRVTLDVALAGDASVRIELPPGARCEWAAAAAPARAPSDDAKAHAR